MTPRVSAAVRPVWMTVVCILAATSAAAVSTPSNVVATTFSTSEVDLTWTAVTGAVSYDVYRSTSGGAFVKTGSTGTISFSDIALSADTTYVYEIQAIDATGTASLLSTPVMATTTVFSDKPLVAGATLIKSAHILELRRAVDAVRLASGLSPYPFTDSSLTSVFVKAIHIGELRSSLNQALPRLAMPSLTPANSAAAGTVIAAVDVSEIRGRVSGVTSTQPAPVSFCARGPASQVFSPSMHGCAGTVSFASRATLCGAGYHVCSANEWVANRGAIAPAYNYWTADVLRYGLGGATNNCYVSLSLTNTGACTTSMLVCAGAIDPLGNTCSWTGCGFNTTTPNQRFGGCPGPAAGTLCCHDPLWYVDAAAGSDANPGTASLPFKTITRALGAATSGQIFVAPGTYSAAAGETFPLDVPVNVALIGDEPNSGGGATPTMINGCGTGRALLAADNATIAGFRITCATGAGIWMNSGTATIRNNTVTSSEYGLYVASASTSPVATGNTITNNQYGIYFAGSSAAGKFEGNAITYNTQYGVEYSVSGGDLGGGAAGSAGGNTISCNAQADLYAVSTAGVSASNNRWDHAPPTSSTASGTGGIDIYATFATTVTSTGASVAPAPCP